MWQKPCVRWAMTLSWSLSIGCVTFHSIVKFQSTCRQKFSPPNGMSWCYWSWQPTALSQAGTGRRPPPAQPPSALQPWPASPSHLALQSYTSATWHACSSTWTRHLASSSAWNNSMTRLVASWSRSHTSSCSSFTLVSLEKSLLVLKLFFCWLMVSLFWDLNSTTS